MRPVAVTQRVDIVPRRGERRDALDQSWTRLLAACGLVAVPMPNHPEVAAAMLAAGPVGLLLTGGNDLARYGGDAPERDETERRLLALARQSGLPVMGVCRGMQVIQDAFGVPLARIEGHVAVRHRLDSIENEVNSFHGFGANTTAPALEVLARAPDGIVEALRHVREPIIGQMWHPERETPFASADLERIRRHFGAGQ
jgi:putative glutamine amidotransferase